MKPFNLLYLLLWLSILSGRAAEPVVTVCQVLERIEDFQCRPVRLQAEVTGGTGTWLITERYPDQDCARRITVDSVEFRNWIAFELASSIFAGCRIQFKDDEESVERFFDAVNHYDSSKERIRVVMDGVIQTRKPPLALVGENRALRGFGHEGAAPAQFIMKKLVSIKVLPIKSAATNKLDRTSLGRQPAHRRSRITRIYLRRPGPHPHRHRPGQLRDQLPLPGRANHHHRSCGKMEAAHADAQIPGPTPGGSVVFTLNGNDARALVLLHELGHQTGVFANDFGAPQLNSQNTLTVLENCLGIQP